MPLSTYLADRLGSAVLEPAAPVEAGSFQSLTLTYTAGFFGIDDSGSLRIVFRHVSDMGLPQFDQPAAPGYVTAHASNGAVLDLRYDAKLNIRPWDRTLQIRVVRGFLREGDRITVCFGDRSAGSPGIRMQTFCEDGFEFRVLVDAIATCDWVALPASPSIRVVPGRPVRWKAVLPTVRRAGERFRLGLKGEDAWGNPSDACDIELGLRAVAIASGRVLPVDGLPESVRLGPGDFARVIDGLSVSEPCELRIDAVGPAGELLARSNPLRIVEPGATRPESGHFEKVLLPYWGDLHGQSGETIGTNTARDYFRFARDRAFLDVCCHQGNDFQITNEFWRDLNELTREFNRDEDFVVFPGYEWSGNTALGGDRNVVYLAEGRPIYRSTHALVADLSDADTDAHDASALFERLASEDALVFAHVGGRYSDIRLAHDGSVEHTVEIHSAWGTFEWLLEDALELGCRVGISANSDGHKGRPGSSYPGAATFGAYGGLTCMLATGLTRAAIAESFRRRHHYATTGNRMLLDVRARSGTPAEQIDERRIARHPDDAAATRSVFSAMMGDIIRFDGDEVDLVVDTVGSAPIERIDIRNGRETIETYRPYGDDDLGRRIRVLWEGAEYRGRGRQTVWDGTARLSGNRFSRVEAINFYNLDKRLEQTDAHTLEWTSLTTGGFCGFDAWLEEDVTGTLEIVTALVKASIPIAEIGATDLVMEAGGIGRRVRIFRLPDSNPHEKVSIERRIRLHKNRDNALYVRVTQEDGHVAWSSPIYIIE